MAGDNRLKICPVWVRVPPALPYKLKYCYLPNKVVR